MSKHLIVLIGLLFISRPVLALDSLSVEEFLSDALRPGLGATMSYDTLPDIDIPPVLATPAPPKIKAPVYNRQLAALFGKLINQVAREQQLDPQLLHAIVTVESGYNPEAVSPKGAQGLMQLMPGTASRFGVSNPIDPLQSLRGGARYLRFLLTHFKQDLTLVIAAYNAGEGAVGKYRNTIPPYRETQEYVAKVLASYEMRTGQPLSGMRHAKPVASHIRPL